ncbi:atlastin-2-like isoform X2 [Oscarella lobularis]|uniref:atlastin-2-like isoform X2 n=1 Tax=Oscarella lobularis TaxID=121494 RepID=UPI0033135152
MFSSSSVDCSEDRNVDSTRVSGLHHGEQGASSATVINAVLKPHDDEDDDYVHVLLNEAEGSPWDIVEINEQTQQLILKEENLKRIMKTVGDAKVAVISIAGAFRRGKSFLLNVFLCYLRYSGYGKMERKWLERCWKEQHAGGYFVSESNIDSVTKGMKMWSQPLWIDKRKRDFAVLLMDTQGLFDGSSKAISSKIFCLTSFVSSWQIVNVGNQFDGTDAENLQAFTEYGASLYNGEEEKEENEKLFPKLTFLIRDWQNTSSKSGCGYQYGFKGGKTYWKTKVKDKFPGMYSSVENCFESIHCCLMPHPGSHVVEAESFSEIDIAKANEKFVTTLETIVSESLFPSCIPCCKNGKKSITAQELFEKFEIAVQCFNESSNDLVSFVTATAQIQHQMALDTAFANYQKVMKILIDPDIEYNPDLTKHHNQEKERAMHNFKKKPKFCEKDMLEEYQTILEKSIDEAYQGYQSQNDHKKITAERDNQKALETAIEVLEQELCPLDYSKDKPFLPKKEIERIRKEAQNAARKAFDEKKSFKGGKAVVEEFEKKFANTTKKRDAQLSENASRTEMEVKRCISEKRETLLEKYKTNMNDFRKNGYVEEMALEGKHSKVKKEVLDQLERDIPKRGGELFRSRHVRKFDGSVEDALQHQLEENKIEKPFFFKELVALAVVGGVLVAAGPAVAVAAGAVELGASVVALTGAAGSVTTGAVNWAKPRWLRKINQSFWRKEKTE